MDDRNDPVSESPQRVLIITRVINAPRELVWKAWTDPEQMARWWGPKDFTNPVCEMDVRPGGAIHIETCGPESSVHPMKGAFHEVIEPERLVFISTAVEDQEGNPQLEVLTTVTFAEHAGGTELAVTAAVVKATPAVAEALAGMEEGWSQSLDCLGEMLAESSGPLVVERTFNAPLARVWKAIATKDDLRRWLFDIDDFKAEAGFEFHFTAKGETMTFVHKCVVTEVVPNERLSYSWRYEGHQGDSMVTFELFPEGERTKVRLTHAGLETFPAIDAFARENYLDGWTSLIGSSLREFVEKGVASN